LEEVRMRGDEAGSDRLTVLNVAYPLAAVSRGAAGGAEQIVSILDARLCRAGHQSIVVAREDSTIQGVLEPTPVVRGELNDEARRIAWREHKSAIARVLERWQVDLIHLHGLDCASYLPSDCFPALVTLHLPVDWYPARLFRLGRENLWFNCVSHSQASLAPRGSQMLDPIPNGIELDEFAGSFRKRNFCLAIGRICHEKGFHHALRAARKANAELLLAGKVFGYPAHKRYYELEIVPLLDGRRRFIGPAGLRAKRKLVAQARCVLIPSLAPETSSLVAMEAMASGTPVIAFRSGALPEIVEHGKTGFLVANEDEMADAISATDQIDPNHCRNTARERFSAAFMFERYLSVYRSLARTRQQVHDDGMD
jgi:glycosyltransferase involved in cell wall biosynthesis